MCGVTLVILYTSFDACLLRKFVVLRHVGQDSPSDCVVGHPFNALGNRLSALSRLLKVLA